MQDIVYVEYIHYAWDFVLCFNYAIGSCYFIHKNKKKFSCTLRQIKSPFELLDCKVDFNIHKLHVYSVERITIIYIFNSTFIYVKCL